MRRIYSLLTALAIFFSISNVLILKTHAATIPAEVVASGECGTEGDNVTWTLYDSGLLEIKGTGAMANTKPWYDDRTSITTVVIGHGITSIGYRAFYNCTNLTSISIPESVTVIDEDAFLDCSSLTSVVIPEGITSIGGGAFSLCGSLQQIRVADNNANYSSDMQGVLYNKDKTVLIAAPGAIGDNVVIPDSVTNIGSSAFCGCTNLTSIVIPNSVTSIGNGAFDRCTSLTSIVIPEGITSIGIGDFNSCSSLTSITIPESVTSIGVGAFWGCTSLSSITIPKRVTRIDAVAFQNCTSLTSIVIPDAVTHIGNRAFSGCSGLLQITVADTNANYCSDTQGVLYSKDKTVLIAATKATGGSIVIPDSVTSIDAYAFYSCIGLNSVEIPEGVTNIGWHAFQDCVSLTSIKIPTRLTSIGGHAFDGCNSLTDVYYSGTEQDKAGIAIDSNNAPLTSATWHYSSVSVDVTPSVGGGTVVVPGDSCLDADTVNTTLNAALAKEQLASAANDIKDSVQVSSAEAISALGSKYDANAAAPTVEIRSYLNAEYSEPTASENANSMKVDLSAWYQVYAVQGDNSAAIGSAEKLDTTGKEITITLVLPDGFIKNAGQSVQIKHYKSSDTTYTYEGTLSQDANGSYTVTFINPNGFSEFEIIATAQTVDTPKFKLNLTLNSTVDMNFKINESDIGEGYYFVVIRDGNTLTAGQYSEKSENSVRHITVSINSDRMCDEVTVQMYNAEGQLLAERTSSIRDYGELLLSTAGFEDRYYRAVIALLDYGSGAQLLSDSNTKAADLANSVVTNAHRNTYFNGVWTTDSSYEMPNTGETSFKLNLTLNSTVDMNFKINEGEIGDGYYFLVIRNGNTLTAGQYSEKSDGSLRHITVSINSDRMCDEVTVQMYNAEGQLLAERTSSIREYGRLLLNTVGFEEQYYRAVVALLDYGACAQLLTDNTTATTALANSHISTADRAHLVWPSWEQ